MPHQPTLRVLCTEYEGQRAGEFVTLGLRAAIGREGGEAPADPVLTLGPAGLARDAADILGCTVRNRPIPRFGAGFGTSFGAGFTARNAIRSAVKHLAADLRAERVVCHGVPGVERVLTGLGVQVASHEPPPDEPARAAAGLPGRGAARAALELGETIAVLPLTDRPEAVDARALLFVAGVLELVDHPIAVVLPDRARRLDEAMTYHRNAKLTAPVRLVSGAWCPALPAADVLIAPADANVDDPMPMAIAERLGVPVAPTAAWSLDPDAAVHSRSAEIRATVGPVLERARAARAATVPV